MPDVVTVRVNPWCQSAETELLLLCNLNTAECQKLYPDIKIDLSKFYELLPRWCVFIGPKSTLTFSFLKHQNVKLLVPALGQKALDYHQFIYMIVCSDQSRDCMLHRC